MNASIEPIGITIDEIDQHSVELLTRRSVCVKQISEIKKQNKLAIYDEKRKRGIIDRFKHFNPTLYHQVDLINIFQAILCSGFHLQLIECTE